MDLLRCLFPSAINPKDQVDKIWGVGNSWLSLHDENTQFDQFVIICTFSFVSLTQMKKCRGNNTFL